MENEYIEEVQEYNEDNITDSISGLLNDDLTEIQPEEVIEEVIETVEEPVIPSDFKVKVKVNGQEQEVTLDELKNGYQRQSDYTQKTQEIAQQKQALTQQESEYNQYLQSIPMLAQVANTNIQDATNRLYAPDFIALATEDPALYISEKAKLERIINQNQVAAQNMHQQYNQYQNELSQRQQAEFNQRLEYANEVLTNSIEGWSDGSALDSIRNYATSTMGFQPNELNGLIDPRQVIVLDKARRYDELMKQNTITQKKVTQIPSKSLRPGTSNTTSQQDEFKAKQRKVLSTGNDRDIASLLAELL
jgi:hypothetical protein